MRAQARTNRRLRVVLTGAVLLLVLALVAGGIAAVQSDRASDSAARADENAAQAEQSAISALARGAAARGTASGDLDTALLLAAAGVVLDESPETVGNLQQVISQNPALIRLHPAHGQRTMSRWTSFPSGRTAALLDGCTLTQPRRPGHRRRARAATDRPSTQRDGPRAGSSVPAPTDA